MTNANEVTILYILNSDRKTNYRNLRTLVTRFGGDSQTLTNCIQNLDTIRNSNIKRIKSHNDINGYNQFCKDYSHDKWIYKFDKDGNKYDGLSDKTSYYDFLKLPYPIIKSVPVFNYMQHATTRDLPNLFLTVIDDESSNFDIKQAKLANYGFNNCGMSVAVIMNNAHDLNINDIKENADAAIVNIIDTPSDFKELKSKYVNTLMHYDIRSLNASIAGSPVMYGLMNHIPELHKQFDYFIEHGKFAKNAFTIDNIYNIIQSALSSDDDLAHSFVVTNMRPTGTDACLIDTFTGDNSVLFANEFIMMLSKYPLNKVIKIANMQMPKIPTNLVSIHNEGLNVLKTMAKSYYEHQKD